MEVRLKKTKIQKKPPKNFFSKKREKQKNGAHTRPVFWLNIWAARSVEFPPNPYTIIRRREMKVHSVAVVGRCSKP